MSKYRVLVFFIRIYSVYLVYIYNFIIILSLVYNEPIQRPAPSWLVSLIGRALHLWGAVLDIIAMCQIKC